MFSVHGKLVLFGVVVHAVLLYSIFDIYYVSPLVQGTHPHSITNGRGPATRVVIFSADGLRSDTFFANPQKSPFLHDIIRNGKGSWGISVSHVPTESRPGHVAMLAGFYEDVSAVARGWKLNPVPFDSVINRSNAAWAWGSPDIVSMFTEGISHATAEVYSSDLEDFFSSDAAELDRWVFNKVEDLLNSSDASRTDRLRSDRAVFFLHLLGLDTNGHGYKPHSKQYINNIGVVDAGIQRITKAFERFYGDNRTAYIFTSDHGMTDWGSHGAGTDAEVLIPFVVWGSGVQVSSFKKEISQVDTSPLISALLGMPFPMNNVGVVPLNLIKASPKYHFQLSYANLKQMLEQFLIKREEKRSHSFSLMFREFPGLNLEILSNIEKEIKRLTELRRFDAAALTCLQWIPQVRAGLLYFHRYERSLLGAAVAFSFISWTVLIYLYASRSSTSIPLDSTIFVPSRGACWILVLTMMIVALHRLPFSNCVYIIMPMYISSVACSIKTFPSKQLYLRGTVRKWLAMSGCMSKPEIALALLRRVAVFGIAGVLLAVFVSVFTHRSLLTLILLLIASIPHIQQQYEQHMKIWFRLWSFCCVILALFPLFPAVGQSPSPVLCVISPVLFFLFQLLLPRYLKNTSVAAFCAVGSGMQGLAAFIMFLVNYSGIGTEGTPLIVRLICWLSIPAAFIIPTLTPRSAAGRILAWFSSLYVPYSLLSLSYESLFLEVFFVLLFVYIRTQFSHISDEEFWELQLRAKRNEYEERGMASSSSFSLSEWLRVLMLLSLIEVAFFGTGNLASLNSFNPSFLRCFVTVFSPFTMTALLIFKIAIPFLVLALAFAVTLQSRRNYLARLSVLLLIVTDTMAVAFFFRLVDDGSWLEIGMSISHYVLCMGISVIMFLLLQLAEYLLPLCFEEITKKKKNAV